MYFLVLQHEPTMMRLLGALGHSTGSSLAMLLGESAGAGTATENSDSDSIPDATFELLTTLTRKASNRTLVLNPLYQYLSSCKNCYFKKSVVLDDRIYIETLTFCSIWAKRIGSSIGCHAVV